MLIVIYPWFYFMLQLFLTVNFVGLFLIIFVDFDFFCLFNCFVSYLIFNFLIFVLALLLCLV